MIFVKMFKKDKGYALTRLQILGYKAPSCLAIESSFISNNIKS